MVAHNRSVCVSKWPRSICQLKFVMWGERGDVVCLSYWEGLAMESVSVLWSGIFRIVLVASLKLSTCVRKIGVGVCSGFIGPQW